MPDKKGYRTPTELANEAEDWLRRGSELDITVDELACRVQANGIFERHKIPAVCKILVSRDMLYPKSERGLYRNRETERKSQRTPPGGGEE